VTTLLTLLPRIRAWRAALAVRPSVRDAVSADYRERLRAFLDSKHAFLWTHHTADRPARLDDPSTRSKQYPRK
jgi:hypothetical protein